MSNRSVSVDLGGLSTTLVMGGMSSSNALDMQDGKNGFWDSAAWYASVSSDEQFVNEVAYMMVTLYRTGSG